MSLRARALFVVLATAAACIDDPSLADDDPLPLTQEEAELLGLGVFRATLEARLAADTAVAPAPRRAAGGPAPAPDTVSAEVTASLPCEFGGSVEALVRVEGIGDDSTGVAELVLTIVQEHRACEQQEGAFHFTLDGFPNVTTVLDFTTDGSGTIYTDGTVTGGTQVTVGKRSGICYVDLVFAGQEDDTGVGTYTLTGSSCGAPVDEAVDVGT